MFSLQQSLRTRGQNLQKQGGGEREVVQTMYICVSKCKNNKMKERKKETLKSST
jgi:hypothetical protein